MLAAAAALTMLGTSCTASTATRAGGEVEPQGLTAGTYQPTGYASGDQLVHLASATSASSAGAVTLSLQAAPEVSEHDPSTTVLGLVRGGQLDIGILAARVLDLVGVTSLQGLQAPLRFTSVEQADALINDPISGRMLEPIRQLGVTPLALTFDGLRDIKGYQGPMTKPPDFAGRSVSFPPSAMTRRTFAALGAIENTTVAGAFEEAIAAGTVAGLDDSINQPNGQAPGTLVGNEFLSLKVNVIVVNTARWEGLTPVQQAALRGAALDTRSFSTTAMAQHRTLDIAAATFCSSGGGDIVIASDADVAAMRVTLLPVVAAIRSDPLTAAVIDRIDQIGASLPNARKAAPCTRKSATSSPWQPVVAQGDQSVLDGTWRFSVDSAPLLATGASAADAQNNAGVWTAAWAGSRFTLVKEGESCHAESRIRQDEVSIIWEGTCGQGFTSRFHRTGDRLVLDRTVGGDAAFLDAFFSNGLRLVTATG